MKNVYITIEFEDGSHRNYLLSKTKVKTPEGVLPAIKIADKDYDWYDAEYVIDPDNELELPQNQKDFEYMLNSEYVAEEGFVECEVSE